MLWTVVAGKPPVATELEGPAGMVRFSADGTLFFQDHTDGTVWVREIENGRLIAKLPGTSGKLVIIAQEKAVKLWPAMVDASRTGDRLVVGGPDHTARVWSIAGEKRSAAEIARIVATRSPWKLDGAVLVHRDAPKKTP